jgi:thiol:disulfide interchange protein
MQTTGGGKDHIGPYPEHRRDQINVSGKGEPMNNRIIVVLAGIGLLACNFLFPPASTPESVPHSNASENFTSAELTIVRLRPKDGDLQTMLTEEAQKAIALGQIPVLEFDATWCPPCQVIDAAIQSKNELMLNAYRETYIIKLDVDEWGWGDSRLHDFQFDGIPVYFKLDSEGRQTGEVIDGGAWGEDLPENIAPVMDEFFHQN